MKLLTNEMTTNTDSKFMPRLFITLTYRGRRWAWDDIDIDIRDYITWLVRKLNIHARIVVGYELGQNSHIHVVLFTPDLTDVDYALEMAVVPRAWKWGRIKDAQEYDPSKKHAAIVYTMGHDVIPFAGEVFHPGKGSCRRGNCGYPKRLEKLA